MAAVKPLVNYSGTIKEVQSGDTLAGLGASDNPQFATIELGAASDTTLSRSAAGKLAVEGVDVCLLSGSQTLTDKTLTTPAISTPTMTGTIIEDVYQITDGAAFEIDPANGSIQYITLGASRTPKGTNFNAGQCVLLMVDDGTAYTLTMTDATFGSGGVTWLTPGGSAPTLRATGYTAFLLFKIGSTVYMMCANPG